MRFSVSGYSAGLGRLLAGGVLSLCFFAGTGTLYAQVTVRRYYDSTQATRLHEEFTVHSATDSTRNGPYTRFFPDGKKTELTGAYRNGKKDGTFTEYY